MICLVYFIVSSPNLLISEYSNPLQSIQTSAIKHLNDIYRFSLTVGPPIRRLVRAQSS